MKPGIAYALLAAALFGASTPLAKRLVGDIHPLLLAGLLYLGSGFGLCRRARRAQAVRAGTSRHRVARRRGLGLARRRNCLRRRPCPGAADVRPHHQRRGGGIAAAQSGSGADGGDRVVRVPRELRSPNRRGHGAASSPAASRFPGRPAAAALAAGSLFIAAACLFWAIDNNLTRKVAAKRCRRRCRTRRDWSAAASRPRCALAAGQPLPAASHA